MKRRNGPGRPLRQDRMRASIIQRGAAAEPQGLPIYEVLAAIVRAARRNADGRVALDAYVARLVHEARGGRSLTAAEAIVVDTASGWTA